MASPLRWVIELYDRVSGPATKASASLGATSDAMDKTAGSTKTLDAAMLKSKIAIANKALEVPRLQKRLEGLNKELQTGQKETVKFGEGWATKLTAVVTAGRAAFDVIGKIAGAAFNLGAGLFEAAAAQDKTNRAFRNLLGNEGPALQAYLGRISKSTEMTKTQLEALALPLARQGLGTKDIARLLPAALDVQARGGDAGQAVDIFSKISSTGKIEGESFKALGLRAPDALAAIGRVAGITDPTAVKKAIEQGKIGANQILEGVLLSIAKGGKLGDAAVEAATSPSAALNKFRNITDIIFSKLADSPALPKLTAALNRLIDVLTSDDVVSRLSGLLGDFADLMVKVDWTALGAGIEKALTALGYIGKATVNTAISVATVATGGISEEEKNFQGAMAWKVGAIPANDFLARSDGSILRINSSDDVLGFKPGGPIEQAMTVPAASGGGGSVVNLSFGDIHVGGGANPDDFRSALREVVAEVWSSYALEEGAA